MFSLLEDPEIPLKGPMFLKSLLLSVVRVQAQSTLWSAVNLMCSCAYENAFNLKEKQKSCVPVHFGMCVTNLCSAQPDSLVSELYLALPNS